MLKYVQGDLIKAAQDGHLNVIAHQANCFCKGRRGIAPLIFSAFPEAKEADDATKVGDKSKLGLYSAAFSPREEGGLLWVFNLYGQYHFDNRREDYGTIYPKLKSALAHMASVLRTNLDVTGFRDEKLKLKVGLPLIGCGLAGGNWFVVEKMIEKTLGMVQGVEVYIYTLDKINGVDYVTR